MQSISISRSLNWHWICCFYFYNNDLYTHTFLPFNYTILNRKSSTLCQHLHTNIKIRMYIWYEWRDEWTARAVQQQALTELKTKNTNVLSNMTVDCMFTCTQCINCCLVRWTYNHKRINNNIQLILVII